MLANIRAKFGNVSMKRVEDFGILKRGESGAIDSDLVDWSTMTLLENLPKGTMSVGDFKNTLNQLTGGKLSDETISAIHAAAIDQIKSGKPSATEEQKAVASVRREHYAEAAKFDADPAEAQAPKIDPKGEKIKAKLSRAKEEFQVNVAQDRLKNRTRVEKATDKFLEVRRAFVLSSPLTLAKLTAAAIERIGIAPMEEIIGGILGKAIPGVASRAPRQGGFNVAAEAKAISAGFVQGMADSWKILKTGKSDLDAAYGKAHPEARSWINFAGELHGALKAPVKRSEFVRSLQKRMTAAAAGGVDITDELVKTRLATEAYQDALRSIFMQDNRVVSAYQKMISGWEEKDKITGEAPLLGKIAATTSRVLLPVVKIPTNIVGETFVYATGAVTGSYKLGRAFAKGTENLSPEEADQILRHLKKGLLGAAVLLLGYFLPDGFGGFYQPGDKRDETDVKFGGVRLFGADVPSYLVHNPLLEVAQLGSTIRRVADSRLKKKDEESQGLSAGVWAGALGLTEEVPFIKTMLSFEKLFDEKKRGQFVGELTKSIVVPQGVQWVAGLTDKDSDGNPRRRKPETLVEHLKTGIPGLRGTVPVAHITPKSSLKDLQKAAEAGSDDEKRELAPMIAKKEMAVDKKEKTAADKKTVADLIERGKRGEKVESEIKNLSTENRKLVVAGIVQSPAKFQITTATDTDKAIEAFEQAPADEKAALVPVLRGKRFRSKSPEAKAKYDAVLSRY